MEEQSAKPWLWVAFAVGLAALLFVASQLSLATKAAAPPPPIDYSLASSAPEPGYKLPATGTLTNRDLANLAKLVRDKAFPDTGLEGRAFAIELPVEEDASGQLAENMFGASYFYPDRRNTLRLTVNLADTQDGRYYFPLQSQQVAIPGQTEDDRNAARNFVDWEIGLGRDDRTPAGVFAPELSGTRVKFLRYRPLVQEVRSIARVKGKLQLRLEGNLDRSTSQHVIDCSVYERTALEGEKLGGVRSTCHINARFTRVAIVYQGRAVLAEWGATSRQPTRLAP